MAHHFLEGAEAAARAADQDTFTWYRASVAADRTEWYTTTTAGPRIILSPDLSSLPRSVISETPYVLLGPDTTAAPAMLRDLSAIAFATAAATGFAALVTGHAAVVCLLRHKQLDDTLDSWTISRLPGTIFTDHVNEPAVLARDLIHEAGHNWLNDALAACGVNEIHACLGAFATTVGTAPKSTAAPTDPPAPADQHTWLGTFACDEVPGVLRLSRHGPALYLWRRGTADQLAHTCTEGQTYTGPGYTLTIPAADTLIHDHLDAFTLDLVRAPALHYRRTSSGSP